MNNNIKSLYQLDIGDRMKNFQKFLYFKYHINVNIVKLIIYIHKVLPSIVDCVYKIIDNKKFLQVKSVVFEPIISHLLVSI